MSVGLCRAEYDRSISSLCNACGADILVGACDGADDLCPSCAMERIRSLERKVDDLETEYDHDRLFMVIAHRLTERLTVSHIRESKRFVVMAQSESTARATLRETLRNDGYWSLHAYRLDGCTMEVDSIPLFTKADVLPSEPLTATSSPATPL